MAKHVLHISGVDTARNISDVVFAHRWEVWTAVLENYRTYQILLQEDQAAVSSQDELPARAPSQDTFSGAVSSQDDIRPMVLGMPSAAPSVASASSTGTDVVMHTPHVAAPSTASGSASAQQTDAPLVRLHSDVAVKLEAEDSDEDEPSTRDIRHGVPTR